MPTRLQVEYLFDHSQRREDIADVVQASHLLGDGRSQQSFAGFSGLWRAFVFIAPGSGSSLLFSCRRSERAAYEFACEEQDNFFVHEAQRQGKVDLL